MRKYRKPYRIKKRKSIFKSRFFWISILTLIIFGTAFYFFLFSEFFQIKEIIVTGEQRVFKEDIESIVKEELEKKILFFRTKSIFLANFSEIKKEILKSFPRVEETDLKRKFPNTVLLQIKERKPAAIFCQDDNCFFIDKEGVIFEPFETNLMKQDLVKLKKEVGREINLGEKMVEEDSFFSTPASRGSSVIEEEQLSKILKIESELREDLKIPISEVLIISEDRLDVKTFEGWEIYFNLKGDINWQMTKLAVVLEKEIPQEKRGNIEYIDLRFSRIYYKYK